MIAPTMLPDTVSSDKQQDSAKRKRRRQRKTKRSQAINWVFDPARAKRARFGDEHQPKKRFLLLPYDGEEPIRIKPLSIPRKNRVIYLIGRRFSDVDLPLDHPSCSNHHAGLEYRLKSLKQNDDSVAEKHFLPYLVDFNSTNGTYVNNVRVQPGKYVRLVEKDVIQFGFCPRRYILLSDNNFMVTMKTNNLLLALL